MIKLLDLLKEYANQGPSSPESYLVENKEIKPIPFSDISKIPNLEYDMGGGETSLYEEYNVVVIDNIPVKEFAQDPGGDKKIYIEYNLENSYSFPKANKIHLSQVVYHITNIEALAKTVNDSLKSNGILDFFSDIMSKEDKQFIKILIENYSFFLPDNTSLNSLSKYKQKNLLLRRGTPYITPKKEKFVPKEWVYDITTKEGNARVKYITDKYEYIDTEKISGTIPDRYFLTDRNSRREGSKPDYIGMRFPIKNNEISKGWNPEKGPFPYYQIPDGDYWKLTPWNIISFKRIQ
jgi:hypothetical protein